MRLNRLGYLVKEGLKEISHTVLCPRIGHHYCGLSYHYGKLFAARREHRRHYHQSGAAKRGSAFVDEELSDEAAMALEAGIRNIPM
jgi:hypothetical protein